MNDFVLVEILSALRDIAKSLRKLREKARKIAMSGIKLRDIYGDMVYDKLILEYKTPFTNLA